jgi:hypothetical protein
MKSASSPPSPAVNPNLFHLMPPKKKSPKSRPDDANQQTRLWLMYPPKLIQQPLIWQLTHKFPVIANIRQASVNDEIGVVCLELDGKRADIKGAIKWLEKIGVSVEPVEINVIES